MKINTLLLLIVGFTNYALADNVQDEIAALKDQSKNVRVRISATIALGELGDVRAVGPLIACLRKDQDKSVKTFAGYALIKIGRPSVEPLIACLKDQDESVRRSAAVALGQLHDAQAVEPLIGSLKDQDRDVRRSAAVALGQLHDARAVDPLIASLKDNDPVVKENAAEALGELGDARAVESLIACLKDDGMGTYAFGQALARLGKPSVVPLIACLKNRARGVRYHAADVLGQLRDAQAVEPLIACLKDQDEIVKANAAQALGKLGDARAAEPLIASLKDQDRRVRYQAFYALDSLGVVRTVEGLVEQLPDWSLNDKIGAALKKLGWKPTSDTEQVYSWICNRDDVNLKANWEKSKQVLLADVRSGNQRKIENAVYTFVSLGREEIVPHFIDILNTQGTAAMAETYLNCGHGGLAESARSWASARGFKIISSSRGGEARWGKW